MSELVIQSLKDRHREDGEQDTGSNGDVMGVSEKGGRLGRILMYDCEGKIAEKN